MNIHTLYVFWQIWELLAFVHFTFWRKTQQWNKIISEAKNFHCAFQWLIHNAINLNSSYYGIEDRIFSKWKLSAVKYKHLKYYSNATKDWIFNSYTTVPKEKLCILCIIIARYYCQILVPMQIKFFPQGSCYDYLASSHMNGIKTKSLTFPLFFTTSD